MQKSHSFANYKTQWQKTHYLFNEVYRDRALYKSAVHNCDVRFKNHQKSQDDDFSGWIAMSRKNKMQPKVTQ
jgi:hypothetical protein